MIRPPKPKPLPRPKTMTIAAGMVCPDGIVIAADSQESWGESKTHIHKISVLDEPKMKAIFTGAGIGWFIDYARDKVFAFLRQTKPARVADVESGFTDLMNSLYEKEFKNFPGDFDKGVSLLLAVKVGDERPALFSCDSVLVRRVKDTRLVGTELWANEANELQQLRLTLIHARWVSAYLIWRGKSSAADVGGRTNVFSLSNDGKIFKENSFLLMRKEHFFDRLEALRNAALLSIHPFTSTSTVSTYQKWIGNVIRETRKEFSAIDAAHKRQEKRVGSWKERNL